VEEGAAMISEPPRNRGIDSLWAPFRQKVATLLQRLAARGFDPVLFETRRSQARQEWLYGYGRTHHKASKPVTWTMHSRHLVGKAVDMISKKRGWNWPEFYDVLKNEAARLGLQIIPQERCHVQWPE
jgi:hypothetical protein